MKYGKASKSWIETRGKILSSTAIYSNSIGSYLKVTYSYTINGKDYTGNKFKYGGKHFLWQDTAGQFVRETLPKGTEVSVYYNPQRPEQAVIEQGIGVDCYWWFVFATIAFALAINTLGSVYRKAKKKRVFANDN